jgi:hypothetical protein
MDEDEVKLCMNMHGEIAEEEDGQETEPEIASSNPEEWERKLAEEVKKTMIK